MADKIKRIPFTSPKGSFVYPKLNDPDKGTDKFPKPNGEYSVRLRMRADSDEAKSLIAKLEPLHKAAVANGEEAFKKLKVEQRKKLKQVTVNDFYSTVYDKETEEPTGEIEFKFSMAASGVSKKTEKKWSRKPAIFNAKGVKLVAPPQIWGGTVGKVSFTVREDGYFIAGSGAAGIKMELEAVQIIDLVSGGQRDAAGYGFGEEEGYDDNPATAPEKADGEFTDETSNTSTENSTDAEDGSEDF